MKKTSTVQLVRNATLKIRYAGHTMLIDPVLADKGTLISALGVNKTPRVHLTIPIQDIIGGVDMVLLTHNHIDHYEPSVPTHLPKEIPFYVQPQDADAIRNDGFTNVIPIEEIKTIDGISIYRTTGHHGFGQIGQMMGPVSGYVLKAEGFPTVYIMGDCRWEACIRDTVERFNPDYIVVNSGGAGRHLDALALVLLLHAPRSKKARLQGHDVRLRHRPDQPRGQPQDGRKDHRRLGRPHHAARRQFPHAAERNGCCASGYLRVRRPDHHPDACAARDRQSRARKVRHRPGRELYRLRLAQLEGTG